MASPQANFPLQVVEEDGRITVRFPANTTLSEANAEAFSHALLALAAGKDRLHLLVDLGSVAMLTSDILTKLIALNAKVRAAGGRLTLFDLTPSVEQVFKVTRLDTLFELQHPVHHSRSKVPEVSGVPS